MVLALPFIYPASPAAAIAGTAAATAGAWIMMEKVQQLAQNGAGSAVIMTQKDKPSCIEMGFAGATSAGVTGSQVQSYMCIMARRQTN
eukprot:CAMPEP_0172931080 /NCGR_PEP_ID=MMETSP1075-20121228/219315_1 /TAXON_ID=2916 /ORGANISM="Ceratium fusus, Strain PA161109" /LENGTH=87 /DNA_ID=CAMNT_0013792395 /DNA_START=30 /DNA_END=294 /DNA_ORIENTATION=-